MDAEQRDLIISTSRKTIVQLGVKAFRMDDIAQSTHVSKRTLYETFGDKEELIFLSLKSHFDDFDRRNATCAKGAPNILVAMLIVMEEVRKNAEVNWQIRSSLRRFYPKTSERLLLDQADQKRKIIINSIEQGIKQGYIQDRINVVLTLNMFSYIAFGISENNDQINIPEEMHIEEAFHEVLITYMRGISTIKGIEAIENYLSQRDENNIN